MYIFVTAFAASGIAGISPALIGVTQRYCFNKSKGIGSGSVLAILHSSRGLNIDATLNAIFYISMSGMPLLMNRVARIHFCAHRQNPAR
jgi:hypothetical protein